METVEENIPKYNFLPSALVSVFQQQSGTDITSALNKVLGAMDSTNRTASIDCLNNAFYWGQVDFRYTPRCQVQNYMLLAFSGVIMVSMLLKCKWRCMAE